MPRRATELWQLLLNYYRIGLFPMADPNADNEIGLFAPDPRCILPLDDFHVSRSLARVIRSRVFEIRTDTAFEEVMACCAESAPGREQTWMSPELMDIYLEIFKNGYAHSIECWQDGKLVGGLYGVAIGGFFAGESMFHRVTDASKVALCALVETLRHSGFTLLDIQFRTPHLSRFGALEISRAAYEARLAKAITLKTRWQLPPADVKDRSLRNDSTGQSEA